MKILFRIYLFADENKITGSLPTQLANLSKLKKISVCKFILLDIVVNDELDNSHKSIDNNLLTGTIPSIYEMLGHIFYLDLGMLIIGMCRYFYFTHAHLIIC